MTVATALAVSWNPLANSNPKAIVRQRTKRTMLPLESPSSRNACMSPLSEPGDVAPSPDLGSALIALHPLQPSDTCVTERWQIGGDVHFVDGRGPAWSTIVVPVLLHGVAQWPTESSFPMT